MRIVSLTSEMNNRENVDIYFYYIYDYYEVFGNSNTVIFLHKPVFKRTHFSF